MSAQPRLRELTGKLESLLVRWEREIYGASVALGGMDLDEADARARVARVADRMAAQMLALNEQHIARTIAEGVARGSRQDRARLSHADKCQIVLPEIEAS